MSELNAIVETAWEAGRKIDLSGIVFGPPLAVWKDKGFTDVAHNYYYFLAGFVRSQRCSRILEIGTHFGGSGLSMLRGVAEPGAANLVSVDITDLNPALHTTPGFTKLTGSGGSVEILRDVLERFPVPEIDLIYVDTNHALMPTAVALGVYGVLLRPRFMILDDINLNDDMRLLWSRIRSVYPDSVDCSELFPKIRVANCGFGLIKLR